MPSPFIPNKEFLPNSDHEFLWNLNQSGNYRGGHFYTLISIFDDTQFDQSPQTKILCIGEMSRSQNILSDVENIMIHDFTSSPGIWADGLRSGTGSH